MGRGGATRDERIEVLAFAHPLAGKQFIKGTIESGQAPIVAAERELREESGLVAPSPLESIGTHLIGADRQRWHFFACTSSGLPETWTYAAENDFGHSFTFFWHSLDVALNQDWDPIFHEAFGFFAPRLANG